MTTNSSNSHTTFPSSNVVRSPENAKSVSVNSAGASARRGSFSNAPADLSEKTSEDQNKELAASHHELVSQLQRHKRSVRATASASEKQIEPESLATAELHLELNRLSSSSADEDTVRAEFRRVVQKFTNAVGVGHVKRDSDGNWDLKPQHATGRVPRRQDFVDRFAHCCSITVERNSIQVESFLGLESFYTPIQIDGKRDEVLLVLSAEGNSAKLIFVLEIVAAYLGLWLKGRGSQRNEWKLTSLAALIELVSDVEKQRNTQSACQVIASDLARHLGVRQVAVATQFGGRLKLQALSGAASVDSSSSLTRAMQTTLSETILHGRLSLWPNENGDQQLLLAHRQLANELSAESVLSIPLRTPDEECLGAVLLAGPGELLQGDRLPNFMRAAAPRLASALEVVHRAQRSRIIRFLRWLRGKLLTGKGQLVAIAAVILTAMMFVPLPYRVRTGCRVEPVNRRFIVAPYDGVVQQGFFEPGDEIQAGELMAKMDAQQLRYELASVRAELQQAKKKREIQLAERNVGSTLLNDLEAKRLQARKELLEYRQEQIEIRSPIDGIVLSGSKEHAKGISVDLGKVLYEIGPVDQVKIQVHIPAEEVSQVDVDNQVRVWIKGLESEAFLGRIDRISPQSELRDAKNVFVADIQVDNTDGRLRPGMEGLVRIDCQPKPLGWNLFHKLSDYLVSRFTWW